MSQQCCPVKSLCIDPANPIQNFSAEAPDPPLFISTNTGWDQGDGGFNTPPIGGSWDSDGCQFTCFSAVSQADADQCAANQQLACADGGGNWQDPPGTPVQNALNDAETCTSFCADGLPFNFTIPAGSVLALNRAHADQIAGSLACKNAALRKICLSSLNPVETCNNSAYIGTITASGGLASATSNQWVLVGGSLPNGLRFAGSIPTFPFVTFAGRTLNIIGTPTQAGTFSFTLRITAPNGDFMQKQFSLCVIDINPSSLPNGTAGTAYNQTLTANCGQTPLNWQVTSGHLPTGLTLDQTTGVISGTPTTAGTFNFVITLQTAAS